MTRKGLVGLLAALALLVGSMGYVASVSAHADYLRSEPASGSTVSAAPHNVRVWFTEAVDIPPRSLLSVWDSQGRQVDRKNTQRDAADPALLTVALEDGLLPGTYTVRWKAVAADGHESEGQFSFTVAPSAPAPAGGDHGQHEAEHAGAAPSGTAAPAQAASPAPQPTGDPHTVKIVADEAGGAVHSHISVTRSGNQLQYRVPVSNHLAQPLELLEVHIELPHGTSYVESATDDGQRPAWDGNVARYYVMGVAADARTGPFNFTVRINSPSDHPHPTLALKVWLRYKTAGEWSASTSRLVIENPLEPGHTASAPSTSGGHDHD